METGPENSLNKEYLYGQPFYPVAPLSWLAPLWSLLCGVATSGAWNWTGSHLLRLFFTLLLAGPLLGMAWAASNQIRRGAKLADDPSNNSGPKPSSVLADRWQAMALPYTLPGSSSHRLATWLATASARWQEVLRPHLGRPVLQLAVSTVFSLSVAGQLGQQSLALVTVSLVLAYAGGLGRGRWASSIFVTVSVPLLMTWLLGHAAYDTLRPVSFSVAAAFAAAFCGYSRLSARPMPSMHGLIWSVGSQLAAAAGLIMVRQPVIAAIVALLATPQLLLIPLLDPSTSTGTQRGVERYFGAVQLQIIISMLLSALGLGYTP